MPLVLVIEMFRHFCCRLAFIVMHVYKRIREMSLRAFSWFSYRFTALLLLAVSLAALCGDGAAAAATTTPTSLPALLWSSAWTGPGSPSSSVLEGGRVFLFVSTFDNEGTTNTLVTLDGATGRVVWNVSNYTSNVLGSSDHGATVFTTSNTSLVAVAASSGAAKWAVELKYALVASIAVFNESIVFAATDHHVRAIDAATGDIRWTFQTNTTVSGKPLMHVSTVIIVDEEYAYALDATNSTHNSPNVLWKAQVLRSPSVPPILFDGRLLLVTNATTTVALNITTGATSWVYTNSFGLSFGASAVSAGVMFLQVEPNAKAIDVLGINATSGAFLWRVESASGSRVSNIVAGSSGGTVFMIVDKVLVAIAGGQLLWAFNAPDETALSPPVVVDGVVYASFGFFVYAFSASTGAQLWSNCTLGSASLPLRYKDELLLVTAEQGMTFAFEIQDS